MSPARPILHPAAIPLRRRSQRRLESRRTGGLVLPWIASLPAADLHLILFALWRWLLGSMEQNTILFAEELLAWLGLTYLPPCSSNLPEILNVDLCRHFVVRDENDIRRDGLYHLAQKVTDSLGYENDHRPFRVVDRTLQSGENVANNFGRSGGVAVLLAMFDVRFDDAFDGRIQKEGRQIALLV